MQPWLPYPHRADRWREAFNNYDHIVVSFSGGKDSQATVERLLRDGAHPERIELWHQHVDGAQAGRLMDWPCTPGYCQAYAEARGLRLYGQWKDGGFEGEMLREDARTAGVWMHDGNGGHKYLAPSARGKLATRRQFPQVSADPNQWASVRYLAPGMFERIDEFERDFGKTIHRSLPVLDRADRGEVYTACLHAPESLKQQAMSAEYAERVQVLGRGLALAPGRSDPQPAQETGEGGRDVREALAEGSA